MEGSLIILSISSQKSRIIVFDLPPHLFLATTVGEALLKEAVLKLLPEGHQVPLELRLVLDPPCLQVGIYVLVNQLLQDQLGEGGLGLCQQGTRTLCVDVFEAEGLELLLLDAVLVELVEDEVQDLLGGTVILHEDAPEAMGDQHCGGCVIFRGGEDDQLAEGGVEMLLIVVVGTGRGLLPPLPFLLLSCAIIAAHFSNIQSLDRLMGLRPVLRLSSRLQVVQLGQLAHAWLISGLEGDGVVDWEDFQRTVRLEKEID